jgi:uncharacterized membrane protein YdbT with pleckstrin-like domain
MTKPVAIKAPKEKKDRSPLARTLQPDEKLFRVATIHWGIYWKSAALFLIALVLLFKIPNLGYFMLLVSAVFLTFAALTKHYMLLALTNTRMLVRQGIIQLDTTQILHSRVESVELERTIMARLLGYATVLITGTGSRVMAVPFIADADAFRSDLNTIILQREQSLNRTDGK